MSRADMLTFTHKSGNTVHYRVTGRLTAADLRTYYAEIDQQFQAFGKLHLLVTVDDFAGYAGARAVLVFLRHEPGLLLRVASYAAVANQLWFRRLITVLNRVVPGIQFRAFTPNKIDAAKHWQKKQGARAQDAKGEK